MAAGEGTEKTDRPVRRIITGHDSDGIAKVVIDSAATNKKFAPTGAVSTLIWSSDRSPATITMGEQPEDYGARVLGTAPLPNGTRFAVIDFPPGSAGTLHRTDTLDYVIAIEGEIEMQLDSSSVTMRAGDVMVQRGTNHGWANKSQVMARLAFVLIDAEPLGLGAALKGAASAH